MTFLKKFFVLFWQFLPFPVLYFPYKILNEQVLMDWLGCGCPRLDENGQIVPHFSANSFTAYFWFAVALFSIIITVINLKRISKWYFKVAYAVVCIFLALFLSNSFYYHMQWN